MAKLIFFSPTILLNFLSLGYNIETSCLLFFYRFDARGIKVKKEAKAHVSTPSLSLSLSLSYYLSLPPSLTLSLFLIPLPLAPSCSLSFSPSLSLLFLFLFKPQNSLTSHQGKLAICSKKSPLAPSGHSWHTHTLHLYVIIRTLVKKC